MYRLSKTIYTKGGDFSFKLWHCSGRNFLGDFFGLREHLTYVSFKLAFTVCLLHGMENGNLFVKEKIKMEIDSPSIAKLEFLIRKVTYFN